MSSEPIRVLIVEDDEDVRESIRYLLRSWPGLTVAGAFAAARPALEQAASLAPHVALVDLGLPDLPGQQLIRGLKARLPDLDALVLTIFDDDDNLFGALRAGATGYLLKDTPPAELARCILDVAAGGAPMSPAIARRVIAELRQDPAGPNPLTPREVEVLELLVKGATYELIGRALGIATSTVQAHIKSMYRKLEVSTKAEATAEAFRRGIVRG